MDDGVKKLGKYLAKKIEESKEEIIEAIESINYDDDEGLEEDDFSEFDEDKPAEEENKEEEPEEELYKEEEEDDKIEDYDGDRQVKSEIPKVVKEVKKKVGIFSKLAKNPKKEAEK